MDKIEADRGKSNCCSTAGKGYARTENSNIVAEDCACPGKGTGFGRADFGPKEKER